MSAPNGETYQIEGPAGASDDDVRTEILRQHPDAGTAAPARPPWLGDFPGQSATGVGAPIPASDAGSTLLDYFRTYEPGSAGFFGGYPKVAGPITNAVAQGVDLSLPGQAIKAATGYAPGELVAKIAIPQTPTQALFYMLMPQVSQAVSAAAVPTGEVLGPAALSKGALWVARHPGTATTAATVPISVAGGAAEGNSVSDIVRDTAINAGAVRAAEGINRLRAGGISERTGDLVSTGVNAGAQGLNWLPYKLSEMYGAPIGMATSAAMRGGQYLVDRGLGWLIGRGQAPRVVNPLVQSGLDLAAQRGAQYLTE